MYRQIEPVINLQDALCSRSNYNGIIIIVVMVIKQMAQKQLIRDFTGASAQGYYNK
jgi:hypothetical protein